MSVESILRAHGLVPSVPSVPKAGDKVGTGKHVTKQRVPNVPSVPTGNGKAGLSPEDMDEDARECFEERAAIGEYEGELPRKKAEEQASRGVFEYWLDDRTHPLMIIAAPGNGQAETEQSLKQRFGAGRVHDVKPYEPKQGHDDEVTP